MDRVNRLGEGVVMIMMKAVRECAGWLEGGRERHREEERDAGEWGGW